MRPGRLTLAGLRYFEPISHTVRSLAHARLVAALWTREDEDEDGFGTTYAAPLRLEDHDGQLVANLDQLL